MSFDLQKIVESKLALRRNLAALPVAEKLRMLDALRERALSLHQAVVMRKDFPPLGNASRPR